MPGAGGWVGTEWPDLETEEGLKVEPEFPGCPAGEGWSGESSSHADIALRAYAIYLSRGGGWSSPAVALEDWLRAERELRGSE